MLTDPNLATRIKQFYQGLFSFGRQPSVEDIRLLSVGRQFRLDEDVWFVLGRDERENNRLEDMRVPGDWLIRMTVRPGPLGLLRHAAETVAGREQEAAIIECLAGMVVRYGKKVVDEPAGRITSYNVCYTKLLRTGLPYQDHGQDGYCREAVAAGRSHRHSSG